MAKVTIHVSAFDYEWEGGAEDKSEVFEQLDSFDLGERAVEHSEVKSATYDIPEPEDTSETEVEDEESD